jgi:HEAT repeat protein
MRMLLVLGCLFAALSPARASTFLDKSIDQWLTLLERGDRAEARRGAAFALGRMGAVGSMALTDLAKRLRDDADGSVRDMAAQAIGEIVLTLGRPPASAWENCGPILLRAARDDRDPRVRRSAVYALGAFGTDATLPALKAALSDRSADVRQNAAWALGRLGPAIDGSVVASLRDRLSDDNALVRRDAANAIMSLAKDVGRDRVKGAGAALFGMAKGDRDGVARKTALAALGQVAGPEHASAADGILPLLKDKDRETARAAAVALAGVGGEHAGHAVRVLREGLSDPDPSVQALAAAALCSAGPRAAAAVDDLGRLLIRSKDPIVRRNCVITLGQIGREAEAAVPAIAEAMEAKPPADDPELRKLEEKVREQAAEALSHIPYPANEKAMPAVRKAIASDPLAEVRLRCVEALFYIDRKGDLERHDLKDTLVKVLEEREEESTLVRYNCARVLAKLYSSDAPDKATEVLLTMLADTKTIVFFETKASGTTGVEGGGGTGISVRTGGSARPLAAQALGWMGARSKNNPAVMDALRRAAADPDVGSADPAKRADAERLVDAAKKALSVIGGAS